MENLRSHRVVGLSAYTMTLLHCNEQYLMLKRAEAKRFAPGKWTGIGGRVESDEFDDVYAAALREIAEETGIAAPSIRRFALRRALLQQRPDNPVTVLFYFTGELDTLVTPACPEGTLHWLTAEEIVAVEVIDNSALVIPLLIEDLHRDPDGTARIVTGAVAFSTTGSLDAIVWSD